MRHFANACERIASTTKKLEKIGIVADYLKPLPPEEAAVAAVFLSGRPFPMWEEATLQVGGRLLWRVVEELSDKSDEELTAAYRTHGDLGSVAAQVLPPPRGIGLTETESTLTAREVQAAFRKMSAVRGPAAKAALVRDLLSQVTPLEAKYIIKIITGDLRIGLKESLVEEAISKAYGCKVGGVQHANMLLGDIGETLRFAARGELAEDASSVKMRMFHPLGFMLASPAPSSDEALSYFKDALVEDKYDGIRAQAHCSGGEVRIFSRTRDDITESFPELPDALAGLPQDAILDGEIVAWSNLTADSDQTGRALPFSALQQRLGRKKVGDQLMRRVPVAYVVFDVLYAGNDLLIDLPLREREQILNELLEAPRAQVGTRLSGSQGRLEFGSTDSAAEQAARTKVLRAPVFQASSPEDLDRLFEAAQGRGN